MPMSKKTAAMTAAILLIMAAGAAVAIWEIIVQPAPPQVENLPPTTQPAPAPLDPMAEFARVYSLPNGEALKWIEPPFVPGRLEFFRRQRPQQAKRNPNGPSAMIIYVHDGRPNISIMRFGNGFAAVGVCRFTLGISLQDIEGDKSLAPGGIKGDILVNPEANPDQILAADEKLIRSATSVPIKLTFRQVQRPVIVFSGKWSPALIDGKVQIFGLTKDTNYRTETGGYGAPNRFAARLSEWLGENVAIEATDLPDSINWLVSSTGDGTPDSLNDIHDRDLICKHITEQTGLTWTEETRTVRRLFME
jgi:hypothetical protein